MNQYDVVFLLNRMIDTTRDIKLMVKHEEIKRMMNGVVL